MLYNLIIINSESGINLANIILSEKGISDDNTQLMSGILKAIESFLKELDMGDIKAFNTHNRKVMIYQEGEALLGLIMDEEDDPKLYEPKLQYLGDLFGNNCKWENFCGDIDIFEEEVELAKTVMALSDDEIVGHLEKSMMAFIETNEITLGYKITNKRDTKASKFKEIEDFELSTFLKSELSHSILENHDLLESILSNVEGVGSFEVSFIDYGKFSILIRHYVSEIHIILFLPGKLNVLKDVNSLIRSIKELGVY